MSVLERAVFRARRRYETWLFVRGALWGLFVFSCALIALLLAQRLLSYKVESQLVLASGMIFMLIGALAELRVRRLAPERIASRIDEYFGLRERVSSAYYVRNSAGTFSEAIVRDATVHLQGMNTGRAFRPQVRSVSHALPIPLIMLVAAYFLLPPMDLLGRRVTAVRKAEQEKVLRAEARNLESQSRKMLEISPREQESASRKIAREMANLSRDMQMQQLSPRQALARLSNLSDQVQAEKQRLQKQEGKRLLGAESKDRAQPSSSLEKELRDAKFAEAAERLQEIAKKLESGAISPEEKKALAQELSQLSKSVQGNAALAKALAQAGDALAKSASGGDGSRASSAAGNLKEAAGVLHDLAGAAKEMEKLEAALTAAEEAKAQIGSGLSDAERMGLCKRCGGACCPHGVCGTCGGECSICGQKGAGAGSGKELGAAIVGRSEGAGPEWGVGSTNLQAGGYDVEKRDTWDKRFSERSADWQEQFVRLYDSRTIDSKTYDTRVTGQKGEGPVAASVEVPGAPMKASPAVGVTRAFLDYRESQKDAIAKESIPLGYKQFVKTYFDSLEPPGQ